MKTFCANTILIWFENLLPSLLPFMIISNILILMHWEHYFVKLLLPAFKKMFQICDSGIYTIVSGFLFGFPMGAKVIGQLYGQKKLTKNEAEFLLSFCNHLSPIYCITFIAPLLYLSTTGTIVFLILFYGVPFVYGFFLRHTFYKDKIFFSKNREMNPFKSYGLSYCLDQSITDALASIAKLGGYMVFFSSTGYLIKIIIQTLTGSNQLFTKIYPLLEISSGLSYMVPGIMEAFVYLTLGGLSCLFQTRSMLKETDLSVNHYCIHKLIHTLIIIMIYGLLIFTKNAII